MKTIRTRSAVPLNGSSPLVALLRGEAGAGERISAVVPVGHARVVLEISGAKHAWKSRVSPLTLKDTMLKREKKPASKGNKA